MRPLSVSCVLLSAFSTVPVASFLAAQSSWTTTTCHQRTSRLRLQALRTPHEEKASTRQIGSTMSYEFVETEIVPIPTDPKDEELVATFADYSSAEQSQTRKWNRKNVIEKPSVWTGRMLVIGAAAIYGTNFAAIKLLDESIPLAASAALRFSLAAAAVSAAVLASTKTNSQESLQDKLGAFAGGAEVGAWYWLGYLCQAIGLETGTASKSAFFNALAVIIVPLLDAAFRDKQLRGSGIVSCLMAVSGVFLLQMAPSSIGTTTSSEPLFQFSNGDVFSVFQAVTFGIGYWRLESVASRFPTQAGLMTVGQLATIATGSVLFWFATDGIPNVDELQIWLSDAFVLKTLIWTGLVSTALALYLETIALKVVSAAELTILMTSVSLWGSLFAYVAMDEVLPPIGMAGGLMIVTGCVFSALAPNNEE